MTVAEVEISTSHRKSPVLPDLVGDNLIDALQATYDNIKEVKMSCFFWKEK